MKRPSPAAGEEPYEEDAEESEIEDEDNEDPARNFVSSAQPSTSRRYVETADKVVADWVIDALERKNKGTGESKEKPALHAVALDAVPGSPLLDDPSTISPTKK